MHGWLANASTVTRYTECLTVDIQLLEKCYFFFLFFVPPLLLSGFNSSFMGAEESSYHHAVLRAKMRLGGGGREAGSGMWGGGWSVCVIQRGREKQTEKEEERSPCVRFTS